MQEFNIILTNKMQILTVNYDNKCNYTRKSDHSDGTTVAQ